MQDIYQRIWDADQQGNGIQAILSSEEGDLDRGFVKVNTNLSSGNLNTRVLTDLHIPASKLLTYRSALKLFDNYALSESDQEVDTPEERAEVHSFIDMILDTAPMQIVRDYIARETGTTLSRERWYNTVMEMWFRKFSQGGDPALSGFEHIIVGEQEGGKAQGYHFWYKYYLDDGYASEVDGNYQNLFPALTNDRIEYHGSQMGDTQQNYPECVTITYKWFAPDYDRHALRPLFKPIGGFFVGCSVEGLIALGTVRGHLGVNAPRQATINGAVYDMALYHGANRKHIRTFYPKFKRPSAGQGTPPSNQTDESPTNPIITPQIAIHQDIQIVAALVNPTGDDVGLETITIINKSATEVAINNWSIVDKNDKKSSFSVTTIGAGDTHRITLDGEHAQLSNKGGMIRLLDDQNRLVHLVSYSREQVQDQGKSIVF